MGNLYEGRGLEVIGDMAAACSNVNFHVIGGSETEVRNWSRRMRSPNIFWHGHIPHGSLPEVVQDMDVLLAPYQNVVGLASKGADTSRYMSPLKIFEYMAHGKAIIASDLPVLREVLEDGVNCIMCQHDAVSEWVKALERMVFDVAFRDKLGRSARECLEAKYTWDKRAQYVLSHLRF